MKRVLRDTTARRWRAIALTAAFASCGLAQAMAAPPVPNGGNNTWTVTSNAEAATLASAACNAAAHTCPTLRDAINGAISGDTIVFDAALDNATIGLTLYSNLQGCVTSDATTCGDGGTLGREFGPSAFFIDGRSITIDATALAHGVTIARDAAANNFRLFDVAPGSGLSLKGLVLSGGIAKGGEGFFGGAALGAGGAIFNQGNLSVDRCTLSNHAALGGSIVSAAGGASGGGAGGRGSTTGNGGGPNGGAVGAAQLSAANGNPAAPGGFGGGGGRGGLSGIGDGLYGGAGGVGGFGGGGGQGGLSSSSTGGGGGDGGTSGFGGGGSGGGVGGTATGTAGVPGFGGGAGIGAGGVGRGGAGAGLGGAIFNDAGTATIRNSTFVGNRTVGGSQVYASAGQGSAFGGAIFNYNGALTLDFTTLVDNTVQQGTGGIAGSLGGTAIYSLGDSLAACSAGGNTCTSSGATLAMNMSVAARSLGSPKDVTLDAINGGTSTATGGGNFIANKQALNGTSLGSLVTVNMAGVTDPKLATTLDANGGSGLTLMPQPGSPLIDPDSGASCPLAIDQRGIARPAGAQCDIGAVEVRGPRITVDVSTPGGIVSLNSPVSLGGFGIVNCSNSNPDYCSTRVSSEAGTPDVTLAYAMQDDYHHAEVAGDCGATVDAQNSQIDIAALASDCTVHVAFAANAISGSVQGLAGSGLVLHLDPGDGGNGEDQAIIAGATTFAFATPVATGASWAITTTQPANPSQTCTTTPNTGAMPASSVSGIVVACTTNTYTIGGTASGIDIAGLVLQLNGADDLPVNGNGPFVFGADLPSGATYAATILSQPAGRSCTLGNASGSVVASSITDVSVTCAAVPQLALSIDDARDFARYGQIVDYTVALTNDGDGDAADVAVTFALSAGFDGAFAQFACYGAGNGATCTQDAGNPLLYHVALPAHRSLTWFVSVPVRADTPDVTVDFSVDADGAATVSDTNTLVIFRDGFDVPYGDGTQSIPVIEGAAAKAILDGDALHEVAIPDAPSAMTTTLLLVRDDAREVHVDHHNVVGLDLVRLHARDADGRERATAWSVTRAGATLEFGSEAAKDASNASGDDAATRNLVLVGANPALLLRR